MPSKTLPKASTNRFQLALTVTQDTSDRLDRLCEARAREYAADGIAKVPKRLQSEVVTRLIFEAAQKLPKKS